MFFALGLFLRERVFLFIRGLRALRPQEPSASRNISRTRYKQNTSSKWWFSSKSSIFDVFRPPEIGYFDPIFDPFSTSATSIREASYWFSLQRRGVSGVKILPLRGIWSLRGHFRVILGSFSRLSKGLRRAKSSFLGSFWALFDPPLKPYFWVIFRAISSIRELSC